MTATLSVEQPALVARDRPRRPRGGWIGAALLVSLALHAGLLGLAVLGTRYSRVVLPPPLVIPATVQLVMSPPGGAPPPAKVRPQPHPAPKVAASASQAAAPAARRAETRPETRAAAIPAPASRAAAIPAPATQASESAAPATHASDSAAAAAPDVPAAAPDVPAASRATAERPQQPAPAAKPEPEAQTEPATKSEPAAKPEPPVKPEPAARPEPAVTTAMAEPAPPLAAAPAPPPSDNTLKFDFSSIQSDTNALVTGPLVVPPSPDIKYHNRKPSYPPAAALRGEQGRVILLVHVSPEGLVTDIEVLRSSGFPLLDRAASDAVATWHFMPSIRDGQPVPAVLPLGFEFALD